MPNAFPPHIDPSLPVVVPVFFGTGNNPDDNDAGQAYSVNGTPHEDLPYKVELWDARKNAVETVLAVTANSSIGYGAYHAATMEYPDRYVTLRHRNRTIAKINGPEH